MYSNYSEDFSWANSKKGEQSTHEPTPPVQGNVGIISHSGGL